MPPSSIAPKTIPRPPPAPNFTGMTLSHLTRLARLAAPHHRGLSYLTHPPPLPSTQQTLNLRVQDLELLTRNQQIQLSDLQQKLHKLTNKVAMRDDSHSSTRKPPPPTHDPPTHDARNLGSARPM